LNSNPIFKFKKHLGTKGQEAGMSYSNKEEERTASRERMRRKRAKGVTKGITEGVTSLPKGRENTGLRQEYVSGESGGRIPLRILTDPSWVGLIRYLGKELDRPAFLSGRMSEVVRLGTSGITVLEANEMVECIG